LLERSKKEKATFASGFISRFKGCIPAEPFIASNIRE
jgi:hypothetical protein